MARDNKIGDGWSQAKYRVGRHFQDQHGRKYYAECERSTNRPIGEVQPLFQAPWLPDFKYARFKRDEDIDSHVFEWDYATMKAEMIAANREYYRKAAQEAASRNWPQPIVGKPVYFQLRQIIGEQPKTPLLAHAAERGDRWLLGVPGAPVNENLNALLAPIDDTDLFLMQLEQGGEYDPAQGKPLSAGDEALMRDIVDQGLAERPAWMGAEPMTGAPAQVPEVKPTPRPSQTKQRTGKSVKLPVPPTEHVPLEMIEV